MQGNVNLPTFRGNLLRKSHKEARCAFENTSNEAPAEYMAPCLQDYNTSTSDCPNICEGQTRRNNDNISLSLLTKSVTSKRLAVPVFD